MAIINPTATATIGGQTGILSGVGTDVSRKVMYYDLNSNAIDATKLTSATVGGGTNTQNTTTMGSLTSAIAGGAGDKASILGTTTFQTGSWTSIIAEFEISATAGASQYLTVGLATSATNPSGASTENNSIGYGYYLDAANSNWQFGTVGNAGGQTIDTNLTNVGDSSWHRVRFEITSTGTIVKCFVDGTQVGTTHTTAANIPSTTANLTVQWMAYDTAGGAAAASIIVRRFRIVLIP